MEAPFFYQVREMGSTQKTTRQKSLPAENVIDFATHRQTPAQKICFIPAWKKDFFLSATLFVAVCRPAKNFPGNVSPDTAYSCHQLR
jgi:hypothetical protein